MGRAIDSLIVFRFLKLLVTPFKDTKAYELGIIDERGKNLRKARKLNTEEEREAYTILHRLVFNIKKLIEKVPGGKTKLGTYAAALGLLLKEGKDLNMVELERDLYKHLSENDLIKLDDINESVGFDFLQEGKYIVTDQLEDLNGNITAEVGDIVYTTENQKPFDNYFGVNLYHVINEDTKKQVMVSEDNIERVRF